MKLKRKQVYGDFKFIKPIIRDEIKKYGCICIHCDKKKLFSKKEVYTNPTCDCQSLNSNLPVIIEPKNKSNLKELKVYQSYTKFRDQVNDLQEKLDMDTVDAKTNFQIQTLKMLIDIIPIAEFEYRSYPKASNMQSLTSSINQVRELLADVMIDEDKGDLARRVIENIIEPYTKDLLQQFLQQHYTTLEVIQKRTSSSEYREIRTYMETNLRDLGKYISERRDFYASKLNEDLT